MAGQVAAKGKLIAVIGDEVSAVCIHNALSKTVHICAYLIMTKTLQLLSLTACKDLLNFGNFYIYKNFKCGKLKFL